MAFDAGFLRAIAGEINFELASSRLERIFQCSRDTFVLEFRGAKKPRHLFLSAGASGGNCYLTERKIDHPDIPPMFCMLLRKHLLGGRFIKAEQLGFERVLRIDVEFYSPLGTFAIRSIFLEMMGKNSNLILCDENGLILGALRSMDITKYPDRPLVAGTIYVPPAARAGTLSFTSDTICDHIASRLKTEHPQTRLTDVLMHSVMGIAPVIARELVFRSTGNVDCVVGDVDTEKLFLQICNLADQINRNFFCGTVVYDRTQQPHKVIEYSYTELTQYRGAHVATFDSPSALMDEVVGSAEARERLRMRTERAESVLRAARKRLAKKLDAQLTDREAALACDRNKLCGDLIMQEIWRVKRGDGVLLAYDYATGNEEKVLLDTKLSPSQNAQRYYKHYRKQKRALTALEEQISSTREQLLYAESIAEALSRVQTPQEAEEICREMESWDYGKRFSKNSVKPGKKIKQPPRVVLQSEVSPNGFRVSVGHNNLQNETLTFSLAQKNDLWFHAKGRPGPHVVLHVDAENVPQAEDLLFAAHLALPEACRRIGSEVDYTKIKYVKHHPARLPGLVNYTNQETVFVRPAD